MGKVCRQMVFLCSGVTEWECQHRDRLAGRDTFLRPALPFWQLPISRLSQAVDPGLPSVKQEPPDPEEDKEDNKDVSTSDLAPEEEAGGAGTPVVSAGGHPTLSWPCFRPTSHGDPDVNSSPDHGDFQPGWIPPPGHSSLVAKVCPTLWGVGMGWGVLARCGPWVMRAVSVLTWASER